MGECFFVPLFFLEATAEPVQEHSEVGQAPLIDFLVAIETEPTGFHTSPPAGIVWVRCVCVMCVQACVSLVTHHCVVLNTRSDLVHLAGYDPRKYGGVGALAEEVELACSQKNAHKGRMH